MKKWAIVIGVVLTSGCAQLNSGPISAGGDTFVLSRQAGAFPTGREPLLVEALKEASAKCESDGKSMSLISSHENQGPYILGNYPKATVTFKCQ